ncbi:MAG: phage tail tube protein [Verrucomicrobiota bacterium]
MGVAFGHTGFIGMGTESTYGTGVAGAHYFRLIEESLKLEQSRMFKKMLSSAVKRRTHKSKRGVGGNFKIAVPYNSFGLILYHALGAKGVAGVGPYTHTFTDGPLPTSFSLEVNRDAAAIGGTSAFRYEGCQIQSLKLSNAVEGWLEADISVLGEDEAMIALPTATYPTDNYISWDELTALTVNGVTIAGSMAELSIENELADSRNKLGSRLRKGLGRKGSLVTGKLELEFEALAQVTLFQDLSNAPIVMTWGDGTRSLSFSLTTAYLNSGTPQMKDEGPIMLELGFEGDLDDLTATLVNNDASYS